MIITNKNFEEIINNNETVLLDFNASWCGPCKMLSPIIDEIERENKDITVGKIDVDNNEELSKMFNVSSIPTLVVIKNKKVVATNVGYTSKDNILKMLKK